MPNISSAGDREGLESRITLVLKQDVDPEEILERLGISKELNVDTFSRGVASETVNKVCRIILNSYQDYFVIDKDRASGKSSFRLKENVEDHLTQLINDPEFRNYLRSRQDIIRDGLKDVVKDMSLELFSNPDSYFAYKVGDKVYNTLDEAAEASARMYPKPHFRKGVKYALGAMVLLGTLLIGYCAGNVQKKTDCGDCKPAAGYAGQNGSAPAAPVTAPAKCIDDVSATCEPCPEGTMNVSFYDVPTKEATCYCDPVSNPGVQPGSTTQSGTTLESGSTTQSGDTSDHNSRHPGSGYDDGSRRHGRRNNDNNGRKNPAKSLNPIVVMPEVVEPLSPQILPPQTEENHGPGYVR
jgi:hypothetical protein